jgi:hypothetical protein
MPSPARKTPPSPTIIIKADQYRIRRELWRRGNLDFLLWPAQERIEESFRGVSKKLFVANCSRRIGKSFWGAKKCLEVGNQGIMPKRKIKYASAVMADVEEIIIPAFESHLHWCPKELIPRWNETKKKYTFPDKSQVQLIGLDKNPDKVRGQYCDLFIFEEAGFIRDLQYLYSSVVVPMFRRRKGARAVMISTPPRTPAHPFQLFCEKAKLEQAYLKMTIYEDPTATPEEIEEYRAECLWESDWEREYLCEFVVDENLAIIPEWKREFEQDLIKDQFFQFYHKYTSMDIGVRRDKTAVLFSYYDFLKGKLMVMDEWTINGPRMTTDKVALAVKEKELENYSSGGHPPKQNTVHRYGDNNNHLLLQDLTTLHQLPFGATTKDTLEAMVNKVRLWVRAGRILVHPRCEQLIGCLRSGVFKENRKEFDYSLLYGHFDALAALIYKVRNIQENLNPIPADYGFAGDSHFVSPDIQKSRSANVETLKKMMGLRKR